MAEIYGFEPADEVWGGVQGILPHILKWIKAANPEQMPIELLLPHFTSVFEAIGPQHIDELDFDIKKIAKRLARYKRVESSDPDWQMRVVEQIKSFLLSERVNSALREKIKEYLG